LLPEGFDLLPAQAGPFHNLFNRHAIPEHFSGIVFAAFFAAFLDPFLATFEKTFLAPISFCSIQGIAMS